MDEELRKAIEEGSTLKRISQIKGFKYPEDARIFLGAVAPTPIMAVNAQDVLKGNKLTEELLQTAGLEASKECKPITDMRASAEYRTLMVAVLTGRAIDESRKRAA